MTSRCLAALLAACLLLLGACAPSQTDSSREGEESSSRSSSAASLSDGASSGTPGGSASSEQASDTASTNTMQTTRTTASRTTAGTTSSYSKDVLNADNLVWVNFARTDGTKTPYLKKISNMTPTWPFQSGSGLDNNTLKLLPSIGALQASGMRVDFMMGMGGIGNTISTGKNDYEYIKVKALSNALLNAGISPYYVYMATSSATARNIGSFLPQEMPDLAKWRQVCQNIAAYLKANDITLSGHEIWNEPDFPEFGSNGQFFKGTWEEYIQTYIAGALGVRDGNPDALVGGVSAATIDKLDMNAFVSKVKAAKAPLDFISWHFYGKAGAINSYGRYLKDYLKSVRAALNAAGPLVQSHLNEFNVMQPGNNVVNGEVFYKSYQMVSPVYDALEYLVNATDLTEVFWAAGFETGDGCALINKNTGERHPAYRALWTYARLPVNRVAYTNTSGDIGVMAGGDASRSGAILYNGGLESAKVRVLLDNVPFTFGSVTVYTIDKNKPGTPAADAPPVTYSKTNISTKLLYVDVEVPLSGAVYIEVNDNSGKSQIEKTRKLGTIVRKDYWYPQRGDNYPYAEIHNRSLSAYVGMNNTVNNGGAACTLTLENLSAIPGFQVNYRCFGNLSKLGGASQLGVRVDYHTSSGYAKSVFYAVGGINGSLSLPIGTGIAPSTIVNTASTEGVISVALKSQAPAQWDGRAQITFVINNCPRQTGASFQIQT